MGIIEDLEDELPDGTDGDEIPDRDGVYDPADDLDSRETWLPEWPAVAPATRELSAEEWGIYGEGNLAAWDEFVAMLNDSRLGQLPAEIRPAAPGGWGQARLPFIQSKQKERGKHLFAIIGTTPETMLRVEGQVGQTTWGTDRAEFIEMEPKVFDYAERFEDGDRPGRFFAVIDDGHLTGPQEGRHRAGAAMLAGISWVPTVVLFESTPFERTEKWRKDDGPGYRKNYPEEML